MDFRKECQHVYDLHYKSGLRDGLAQLRNSPEYTQKSFDDGFNQEFIRSLHISTMTGFLDFFIQNLQDLDLKNQLQDLKFSLEAFPKQQERVSEKLQQHLLNVYGKSTSSTGTSVFLEVLRVYDWDAESDDGELALLTKKFLELYHKLEAITRDSALIENLSR